MKKMIIVSAFLLAAFTASAQEKETTTQPPKKTKVESSYLWGLFKSKGYTQPQKDTVAVKKFQLMTDIPVDTTKYEHKSILGGAIQWTTKKKKEEGSE